MNVSLKELVYFQKFKNKIKHNIIVFGSGRWAKVIISELLENFPNIKHIIIYIFHVACRREIHLQSVSLIYKRRIAIKAKKHKL